MITFDTETTSKNVVLTHIRNEMIMSGNEVISYKLLTKRKRGPYQPNWKVKEKYTNKDQDNKLLIRRK